jgi:hypothetical protein
VKRAFPNERKGGGSRYRKVEALLLRWEDDDMDVKYELEDLEEVFKQYGFHTEKWLIPSIDSHLELNIQCANFVKKHGSEDCLIIVYYGGHASINAARQSTWAW